MLGVQLGKTFLGISYILQGIPYVNLLGFILVPIAWLIEGFRERKGLWIGTGISGLVSFGLIIAGLVNVVRALHLFRLMRFSGMSSLPSNTLPGNITNLISGSNPVLLGSLLVIVAGLLLGFIYFILMLISVFQAGSMYLSTTLKVGGVIYVVTAVLIGLVIGVALMSFAAHPALPHTPQALISLGAIYVTSIISAILSLAASIIVGVGFLTIHEEPKTSEGPA